MTSDERKQQRKASYILNLDSGRVEISIPFHLTEGDKADLDELLELVIRQTERRITRRLDAAKKELEGV